MPTFGRGCLAALLLLACPAFAAGQWIRLKSSNFELLTTAGEKRAREAILQFEQVRSMFEKMSGSQIAPSTPVRIIAFSSEKEFRPYATKEFAAAYYVGSRERDYIVMRGITPENYPVAVHEYTHLIIKHSGMKLPIWLNEGMAELFSTLKSTGKSVRMGDVIPGRLQQLQSGPYLELEEMLGARYDSAHYNEKQKAGLFYSQSWGLAHMLYFSGGYRARLGDFLKRVQPDSTQPALIQEVFGKDLKQLRDDLDSYVRQSAFYAVTFDVKVEKSAEEPETRPASELEAGLALAELLAVTRKREDATAAYEKLAAAYPRDPEIPAAMARLSWMNGDQDGIRRHFARAIELGTTNARIYFDYAGLLQESGAGPAESEAMLRKAVALDPSLAAAHLRLGFYSMNAGRFGQAIADLRQIKKIDREQAFEYFRALGYAFYRVNDGVEAKKHAESALKYAAGDREKQLATELLAYITRAPGGPPLASPVTEEGPPRLQRRPSQDVAAALDFPVTEYVEKTLPVKGVLKQVDCLDNGNARLRLDVGGAERAYLIDDPGKVIIKRSAAGATHDFTCGPQKPVSVGIGYVERADPGQGVDGLVRTLEFF